MSAKSINCNIPASEGYNIDKIRRVFVLPAAPVNWVEINNQQVRLTEYVAAAKYKSEAKIAAAKTELSRLKGNIIRSYTAKFYSEVGVLSFDSNGIPSFRFADGNYLKIREDFKFTIMSLVKPTNHLL
jgi:hypothetical protein